MDTSPDSSNMKLLILCAALVSIIGTTVWFYPPHSWRGATAKTQEQCNRQEDCILEAVFRYEMQNSEGHEPSSLFFLSLEDGRDPNDELVKRLASGSFRIKRVSQSTNQRTLIADQDTGEPGVILGAGKVTWVDKDKVQVGVSSYSGWGDVKAYVYHLAHMEHGWVVMDREFALES
jgi:hypothetical protein